ncbi:hypothetical protein EDB80DRAFT_734835, partial [Ilyonectria destructans]
MRSGLVVWTPTSFVATHPVSVSTALPVSKTATGLPVTKAEFSILCDSQASRTWQGDFLVGNSKAHKLLSVQPPHSSRPQQMKPPKTP